MGLLVDKCSLGIELGDSSEDELGLVFALLFAFIVDDGEDEEVGIISRLDDLSSLAGTSSSHALSPCFVDCCCCSCCSWSTKSSCSIDSAPAAAAAAAPAPDLPSFPVLVACSSLLDDDVDDEDGLGVFLWSNNFFIRFIFSIFEN